MCDYLESIKIHENTWHIYITARESSNGQSSKKITFKRQLENSGVIKVTYLIQRKRTNKSACDCIYQLSSGTEICKGVANHIEKEPIMYVASN